ncbi:VOC family protein [Kribbella italica]|uniref:Putative 3-demethylubiquinone-9 3-methyltransferase (Glyoxalase superfamily) n=1 Tax=Kribbella italica TaxID=1540520 RepID=A0A7W9JG25_9ACTN|nr:VOC family protein [Kribbella italica]MBB5841476.1 putative 3-demethylubiquinone-9 3-methyltransferase (glyoxalase superfamily) [Kribbella italica]
MQLSTFLWFDDQAEEAAEQYTTLFPASKILDRQRGADGQVTAITFELAGQRVVAYNGNSHLTFTKALSLHVVCDTQDDIDTAWAGLTDGGEPGPGGSLTDRFGVSWQIVPRTLAGLLTDADPAVAERILATLHTMTKIDVQALITAGAQASVAQASVAQASVVRAVAPTGGPLTIGE